MVQKCWFTHSTAFNNNLSEYPEIINSRKRLGGELSVIEQAAVARNMVKSVGLELSTVTDPYLNSKMPFEDIKWAARRPRTSPTFGNKKYRARCFKDRGILNDNEGPNTPVSESEKLYPSILGHRSSDNTESTHNKKQRVGLVHCTSRLSQLLLHLENLHQEKNTVDGSTDLKEHSENLYELPDCYGISLLADAACGSIMVGESMNIEGSVPEQLCDDSGDSHISSNGTDASFRKDRLHWDLNTSMDLWETPYNEEPSGNSPATNVRVEDGPHDTKPVSLEPYDGQEGLGDDKQATKLVDSKSPSIGVPEDVCALDGSKVTDMLSFSCDTKPVSLELYEGQEGRGDGKHAPKLVDSRSPSTSVPEDVCALDGSKVTNKLAFSCDSLDANRNGDGHDTKPVSLELYEGQEGLSDGKHAPELVDSRSRSISDPGDLSTLDGSKVTDKLAFSCDIFDANRNEEKPSFSVPHVDDSALQEHCLEDGPVLTTDIAVDEPSYPLSSGDACGPESGPLMNDSGIDIPEGNTDNTFASYLVINYDSRPLTKVDTEDESRASFYSDELVQDTCGMSREIAVTDALDNNDCNQSLDGAPSPHELPESLDSYVNNTPEVSLEGHFDCDYNFRAFETGSDHASGMEKLELLTDDDSQYEDGEIRETSIINRGEDVADENGEEYRSRDDEDVTALHFNNAECRNTGLLEVDNAYIDSAQFGKNNKDTVIQPFLIDGLSKTEIYDDGSVMRNAGMLSESDGVRELILSESLRFKSSGWNHLPERCGHSKDPSSMAESVRKAMGSTLRKHSPPYCDRPNLFEASSGKYIGATRFVAVNKPYLGDVDNGKSLTGARPSLHTRGRGREGHHFYSRSRREISRSPSGYYAPGSFMRLGSKDAVTAVKAKLQSNGFVIASDGTLLKSGSTLRRPINSSSQRTQDSFRRRSPIGREEGFGTPRGFGNHRERSPSRRTTVRRGKDSGYGLGASTMNRREQYHAVGPYRRSLSRTERSFSPHRRPLRRSPSYSRSPSRSRTRSSPWTPPREGSDRPAYFRSEIEWNRKRSPVRRSGFRHMADQGPSARGLSSPSLSSRLVEGRKGLMDPFGEREDSRTPGRRPPNRLRADELY